MIYIKKERTTVQRKKTYGNFPNDLLDFLSGPGRPQMQRKLRSFLYLNAVYVVRYLVRSLRIGSDVYPLFTSLARCFNGLMLHRVIGGYKIKVKGRFSRRTRKSFFLRNFSSIPGKVS